MSLAVVILLVVWALCGVVGWLASVGHRHPVVRVSVLTGMVPAEALTPGEDWPELHGSFGEVIEKLRATA